MTFSADGDGSSMAGPIDRILGASIDRLAVFGFFLVIILATLPPILLGVFGALVFIGWALVHYGVFESERSQSRDPLATLQTRYARGEIDEAEFERRLDRIMESTEIVRNRGRERTRGGSRTPSDAGSDSDRGAVRLDGIDPDGEPETEFESEPERT